MTICLLKAFTCCVVIVAVLLFALPAPGLAFTGCPTPSFAPAQTAVTPSVPVTNAVYLAAINFNRDGALDLVAETVEPSGSALSDSVSILFGSGTGEFSAASATSAPPTRFSFGGFNATVAVGDFNGDGNPDIAAVDCSNNFFLPGLVLLGDGTGVAAVILPAAGVLGPRCAGLWRMESADS